jgi:hypothetical protein
MILLKHPARGHSTEKNEHALYEACLRLEMLDFYYSITEREDVSIPYIMQYRCSHHEGKKVLIGDGSPNEAKCAYSPTK